MKDNAHEELKQKTINFEEEERGYNKEQVDAYIKSLNVSNDEKAPKSKKGLIIPDIIFYFALVLIVGFAVLFSRGNFGSQAIGGFRFYEVLTTSMNSVYPQGSLILIKEVAADELVVGDDITFMKDADTIVTHRIIEIKKDYEETGDRAFVTKGVDNAAPDDEMTLATNVVGKVIKGFPRIGEILSWLGDNLWLILAIFLLLMVLSFSLKVLNRERKKIKDNG